MFVFGTADDVFAMAVRIEENGNAFYKGAAAIADDAKLKKLFEDLAAMEQGHVLFFKTLRGQLPATIPTEAVWDPEGLAESYLQATADTHIFTVKAVDQRLKAVKTVGDALDVALLFEKDSVSFFLGMKELLPDAKDKGEIDKLIQAEMDHVRILSSVQKELGETGTVKLFSD